MAENSLLKQKLLERIIDLQDAVVLEQAKTKGNKPLRNRNAGMIAAYTQVINDIISGDYDRIAYGCTTINENAHIPD